MKSLRAVVGWRAAASRTFAALRPGRRAGWRTLLLPALAAGAFVGIAMVVTFAVEGTLPLKRALCWARIQEGQAARARPVCQEAVALRRDSATTVNLGHTYLLEGDLESAYRWYRQSVALVESEQELQEGPLADFLVFMQKGWQVEASHSAYRWFDEGFGDLARARARTDEAFEQYRAGRYADALTLAQEALELTERVLGAEHPDTGTNLNNLALLYQEMGRYEQALPLYQRALSISEKANGPESGSTGTNLNNLALLYQAMGHYEKALPLLQRALSITENVQGPEHPNAGKTLNNLAVLYQDMGRYEQSLPLYQRALAIGEKGQGLEHPSTGARLNNLAGLYQAMGRYEQALPLYQRTLTIAEKAEGADHPNTGASLNNLAVLYEKMGRYEQALPLYQRALDIAEKARGPEHPNTASSLGNLAALFQAMGRYEQALSLFQRALAISEKVLGPEHPDTGTSLNNLATLYVAMGRPAEALPLWQRAERIAVASGSPELQWRVQDHLSDAYAARAEPDLAAYWGKQAVNTIQTLRGRVSQLGGEFQQSFLQDKRSVYTRLSDLLIRQGRLPEAQQVMALLKQEEYFDFVRRDAAVKPASSELTLTGAERRAHEQFYAVRERLASLAQEAAAIRERERRGGASAADEQRLAELQPQLAAARRAFDDFIAGLGKLLAASRPEDARSVRETTSALGTTLGSLREAGRNVAALQYVVSPQRLHIIVTTQRLQWAREVALPEAELNQRIAKFRDAVQNPRLDPGALGAALHAQLVEPVARELAEQGIDTLLLVLDGSLRYLPFAALQDRQGQHLIEQYRLVLHTPASQAVLGLGPQPSWQVAALGVTRGYPQQNFAPLPAVKGELEAIVGPQMLPGQAFLDERFTRAQLERSLRSPVLHIASHFRFVPGSDASFLLLGDGSNLTLAQVRHELPRLDEVELLTLSACDTATGGGRRENGLEVEGLGMLAQQQGAKAVLATLWPVADASTGQLMQGFYRNRQQQAMNKAEALRQAQLALLRGSASAATADAAAPQAAARGARLASAPGAESAPAAYSASARAPHAHPYFWAPFILMGNWL